MDPPTAGWIVGIMVVLVAVVFLVVTRRRDRNPLGPAGAPPPVLPVVSLTAAELAGLAEAKAFVDALR